MRIPDLAIGLRGLVGLAAAVTVVLGTVDAGSIMLTKLSVPDDVRSAGQAAVTATKNQPATGQTALVAFEAANADARSFGIEVSSKDFTLYHDGRVTLTASATAPTLLLQRLTPLRHLANITETVTVEPLPFS